MRAVTVTEPGGPEVLTISELPDPEPGPGEVLIDVAATAVNRADLLQRQGFYPPPPGASGVIGLECSGTIADVGEGVTGWDVGTPVCALLAGGGYAGRVVVPAAQVMPVPDGVDLVTAAALPEVACTVWSNVFMIAGLQPGDAFLVHGGAGGIGTMAIQLTTALGARVFATAGSEEKLDLCRSLGAEVAISYKDEDFVEVVRAHTDGRGADVVLDNMGAKYLERNVSVLADEGRLVVIGLQGGVKAELDLGQLLRKRGAVIATALRSRPVDGKAAICASVVEHVWPLVADGKVKPIVHRVLPMELAAEAHRIVEAGSHSGKVLMTASIGLTP
jgi:putative PIG3 family NAD(P)H quinone oxidoreductase